MTYIEQHDGGSWITDSRVSLDSIVYAFQAGDSPESIAQSFPALRLEQVYGAIAYYLAHRDEVDEYLRKAEDQYQVLLQKSRDADPMFYQKFHSRDTR